MKKLLLLILCLPILGTAQKEYSYINDRAFLSAVDLYGYTFIPHKGKLSNAHFEDPIKLGLVQIEVTSSGVTVLERVTFSTSGIKGENKSEPHTMAIPRTDKTGYGYELTLMNQRNANIQGYMKIFISRGYVTKILYKPEEATTERTYYLPPPSEYVENRDSKFFTHEEDINIAEFENIFGMRFYPFSDLVDRFDYREFTRIYPVDQVSVKIDERVLKLGKKGKREKDVQYVMIKDARNKENPETEFLIKKYKTIRWEDPIQGKGRKAWEVRVEDETTGEEFKILFFYSNQQKLTGIRIGKMEYHFRPGKRSNE